MSLTLTGIGYNLVHGMHPFYVQMSNEQQLDIFLNYLLDLDEDNCTNGEPQS